MEHVLPVSDSASRRLSRLGVAAGCIFVLGGGLFALGAFLAQLGTTSLTTVNVTYLVGGFFFSLGGYTTIVLAAAGRPPGLAPGGARSCCSWARCSSR